MKLRLSRAKTLTAREQRQCEKEIMVFIAAMIALTEF